MAQTVIGQVAEPVQEERAMDKVYRHSIVESHYTPHTSLLSFVSGSPTLVEWYRGSISAEDGIDLLFDIYEVNKSFFTKFMSKLQKKVGKKKGAKKTK
jgi:hypothetical protein